ncbi:MAG: sigma-70 family RNA polymerase sigma factor [Prevotellaceae bacterium]|jgi:RNA polymerase sigma-70 factor (ECF subfamily)|nr:sigma-70 family RNA polymerase sigma factor [Prevotellaceae bacterium]
MNFIENDINEIVAGCKNMNSKAQHRLYEIYAKRMTALCYRYCNDQETARDIMHDGFIKVFSYINSYRGGNFDAWLKKIFVNTALDRLRKDNALKDAVTIQGLENFMADKSPDFTESIDIKNIINAISQLPSVMRTVFNMYNFDGYSLDEIAKELKMTASAIRSQHARAKQKLQIILKQKYEIF